MSVKSNDLERLATCSCGQLSVVVRRDPVRVSVCHCLECQRRTGSVFGVQARFSRNEAAVHGISEIYTRTGDSGERISFRFCPKCGSTVYYTLENHPDVIAIPVGAFADSDFPEPDVSVYESRRHTWVRIPPSAEKFD